MEVILVNLKILNGMITNEPETGEHWGSVIWCEYV